MHNFDSLPLSKSFIFKTFIKLLFSYKKFLGLSVLAIITAVSAILFIGVGLHRLIDEGFSRHDFNLVNQAFFLLIICSLILAFASFMRIYTTSLLSHRFSTSLRQNLFQCYLRLDQTTITSFHTSDFISRLQTDVDKLESVLKSTAGVALRSLIQSCGAIILLMTINIKLVLCVFLLIIVCLVPLIFIGKSLRKQSTHLQIAFSNIRTFSYEMITALHTVQSFTQEEKIDISYKNLTNNYLINLEKYNYFRALGISSIIAFILLSISFMSWIGAQDVFQEKMTFGDLSAFLFYAIIVVSSFNSLSEASEEISSAFKAFKRIIAFQNYVSPFYENKALNTLIPVQNRDLDFVLCLQNVVFSYPKRNKVLTLNNFSLDIKQGQTIAIVGPSGSGKSTLFQLLQKFYIPQSGNILINGKNIKTLTLNEIRKNFALIPQNIDIFNVSLKENILFSKPQASLKELHQVLDQAGLNPLIEILPHNVETLLGENGILLSGGQKQRLGIARALLYQAPILLMDEGTNSLDTESEHQIQKALDSAFQGKTRIIIAHRLSTVIKADHIVVLNQGQIVDQGKHEVLIQRKGLYADLAEKQFIDPLDS